MELTPRLFVIIIIALEDVQFLSSLLFTFNVTRPHDNTGVTSLSNKLGIIINIHNIFELLDMCSDFYFYISSYVTPVRKKQYSRLSIYSQCWSFLGHMAEGPTSWGNTFWKHRYCWDSNPNLKVSIPCL